MQVMLLVLTVAALVGTLGRSGQEGTTPLAIRLRADMPSSLAGRELFVWEELPIDLLIENHGESRVPLSSQLMAGPYGEATLVAQVLYLSDPREPAEEFLLGADARSNCTSENEGLLLGEKRFLQGSVAVKLVSSSVTPGVMKELLVSAFPNPGRYRLYVVYSWAGRKAVSNAVEVDVHEAPEDGKRAVEILRNMGREGLWIYRPGYMPADPGPQRLSAIARLARDHGGNPYSDYARAAMARHHVGLARSPGVDSGSRETHMQEALSYLEGITARGLPRPEVAEELRRSIRQLLDR